MRMTRQLRITAVATLALIGLTGCDADVLDVAPKDQLSDEAVFTDPSLAAAFLADIYRGLGHGLHEMQIGSIGDETYFTHGRGIDEVNRSIISPSNLGALGDTRYFSRFLWQPTYSRIRQTNIFLSQIDGTTFPEATRNRMKGEALFLRANFYHNLMRFYGGVPIIDKVYGLGEDYKVPRAGFKETIDFIVRDADEAARLLPTTVASAELGRATKGAALALKSRTLLHAASDLYHVNPSRLPETGYTTGQNRAAQWRAAKDAAKAVMDLGLYRLFRPNPANAVEATRNYVDLFLQKTSEEAIMSRYFLTNRGDDYHPGLHNGPNGYHNWAGNTPVQNLVDDYRMLDGSRFSWSNPAHAANPYANRDPRFEASILHDGSPWRERPSDVAKLDPNNVIQTFTGLRLPNGSIMPGLDTRKGPVEDWNGSYTGYYQRKFIDPTLNAQFVKQEVPWIFFRYAEILLNYAEASIELGELGDARDALNQIRRRAGMPELSAGLSQAQLREEYRNERRVELVFEEHRFFDIRRWMIAPQVMSTPAAGITIALEGASGTDRSTWRNYQYTVGPNVQARAWNDKLYFAPIHRDEINRNDQLKQNPGY